MATMASGRKTVSIRKLFAIPSVVGLKASQKAMAMDRTVLVEGRRRYLRAVIRASGLGTMAALAKRLKVTQSTLSNIQSGVRSAGPELLDKIRKLAPGVEGSSVLAAEAIARLPEPASEVRQSLGDRLAWGQLERIQELQGLEEALATNIEETARNLMPWTGM